GRRQARRRLARPGAPADRQGRRQGALVVLDHARVAADAGAIAARLLGAGSLARLGAVPRAAARAGRDLLLLGARRLLGARAGHATRRQQVPRVGRPVPRLDAAGYPDRVKAIAVWIAIMSLAGCATTHDKRASSAPRWPSNLTTGVVFLGFGVAS